MTAILRVHLATALCVYLASSACAEIVTSPAMPISKRLTVQPVILANNNGSNQAHFFGTAPHQATIEGMVDKIWAQAGIDIEWLEPIVWRKTIYSSISNAQTTNVVNEANSAGMTSADPKVLNAFFTHTINSVTPTANHAKGTAFYNPTGSSYNGTFQALGSQTVSTPTNYQVAARLTSHEFGHNLGLLQAAGNDWPNLMLESDPNATADEKLTSNQITTVRNSGFLTEYFPGDFNGDRAVDGADFLVWKNSFGGSTANGDADEDGDVDGADFLTMQRNVQQAPSLQANTLAVPEPSSLVLATAFLALLSFRKRR